MPFLVKNSYIYHKKPHYMQYTITPVRLLLLITIFLTATARAFAGNTLTILPDFYRIDQQKHLILVNTGAATLRAGVAVPIQQLQLDTLYELAQPLRAIDRRQAYSLTRAGRPYTLYFTELPLISITAKKAITDSPSVLATFSLTATSGAVTKAAMGIEVRGGSSQGRPKKSYELSFWADTVGQTSQDVQLLGMRTDNKWNLQALYNEPLRLRSKVSNELWLDIHQLYYKDKEPDAKDGISMVYTEVFINGQYKGVYTLSERVDRKQLKLKKYNKGITGELYKGVDWDGPVLYTGIRPFDNTSTRWGGFEYKHPEEQTDWLNLYQFVDFVVSSDEQTFNRDYAKWFEVSNAVDYYLFLNLLKGYDNVGKNLYVAKYKQGEPYYFVPWDLDGVFGTDWLGQNVVGPNDMLGNGFYKRLMQDRSATGFSAKAAQRWKYLRTTVLTESSLLERFRRNHQYLLDNNVYEREAVAWNDYTYQETQLTKLVTWIGSRLAYLDGYFDQQNNSVLATAAASAPASLKLYPNPTADYLYIENSGPACELRLRDLSGREVLRHSLPAKSGVRQIAVQQLAKGLYVATLKSATSLRTEKVVLK